MNKRIELPLVPPVYSTYMNMGPGSAIISKNPSIRNWYLQDQIMLQCSRRFFSGYTSPQLILKDGNWPHNPYLEHRRMLFSELGDGVDEMIRKLIDEEYYVYFSGVDDYYMEGKSWYGERHFNHDGLICGYDTAEDTYCIYAYDKDWVYRTFWMPCKCFEEGRNSMPNPNFGGYIWAVRPKTEPVPFLPEIAAEKIAEYLDSTLEKYPEDGEGQVFGIVVHDYLVKYIGLLFDGFIPYERMDWRIFRLIWEHKKVMLERIQRMEVAYGMDAAISRQYVPLVAEADAIRLMYASHHTRRRDAILPIIQKKLLSIKETEEKLLNALLEKDKGTVVK